MLTRRIFIAILLLTCTLSAQERVDVTVPITKTISTWKVDTFLVRPEHGIIYIRLVGNTGEYREKEYNSGTTPTGATLVSQLNTANLSTRSLYQRILDRLIADGVIEGNVVGTPR